MIPQCQESGAVVKFMRLAFRLIQDSSNEEVVGRLKNHQLAVVSGRA